MLGTLCTNQAYGVSNQDLKKKIELLAQQLEMLKKELDQQKQVAVDNTSKIEEVDDILGEKEETWDMASRFRKKLYLSHWSSSGR